MPWYATVQYGTADRCPNPPRGPWRTPEAARAAIRRWENVDPAWRSSEINRLGLAVRAYSTRAAARDADISDQARQVWTA